MLKPTWDGGHPDDKIKDLRKYHRREMQLLDFLNKTIPDDLNVKYSMNTTCVRINLHLHPWGDGTFSEEDTRKLLAWATENFCKPRREIQGDTKEIYYTVCGKIKMNQKTELFISVYIDESHPLSCQIQPVVKEVIVYEAVCEDE